MNNFLYHISNMKDKDCNIAINLYKQFLEKDFNNGSLTLSFQYVYQSVFFELYQLLMQNERYGEALYYYHALPYYFQNKTSQLKARYDINEIKKLIFEKTLSVLKKSRKTINIVYYADINTNQDLNMCTTARQLNFFYIPTFKDLRKLTPGLLANYHLFIIHSRNIEKSIEMIRTIKITSNLIICLSVNTLQDAKRMYLNANYRNLIDYFIYNKKMECGVMHIAMWKFKLL